jgi:hypothetical protein
MDRNDRNASVFGGLWQAMRALWLVEDAAVAGLDNRLRADIGLNPRPTQRLILAPLVFCWVR